MTEGNDGAALMARKEGAGRRNRGVNVVSVPPRTRSMPNGHPADGMTMHVPIGDGASMDIIDPRSFEDGGPEWVCRYGNVQAIRYTVASLLASYDYLLCDQITMQEATQRLRLMRAYRRAATAPIQGNSAPASPPAPRSGHAPSGADTQSPEPTSVTEHMGQ